MPVSERQPEHAMVTGSPATKVDRPEPSLVLEVRDLREHGVFQRLRVTPAPTWTIMSSRLAMQIIANQVIALVVVIIGTRMHHLSPSAGQYALVLLVSILGGAVFLSIGQALVGLMRSADTVNAVARVIFIALVILLPRAEWIARQRVGVDLGWTPIGLVMTLFAGVLNLTAWSTRDTLALVVSVAYIVGFAGIGIRWFQWDAR
jgi:ABC-2 type transport system permease protein